MTHTHHPVRSTLVGLIALVGILLVVVGFPALLLAVGHLPNPGGWSVQGLIEALTRPDDGTLFLTALTTMAWASWALFTALIALEVVAQLRRRPVLRLPGLGWAQGLAAALVSTVVVGLSSQTAMAATAEIVPMEATQASASISDVSAASGIQENAHRSAQESADNTYAVQESDTYWSIAESQLGSGERYTEIVDLNRDQVMGDGVILTGDEFPHPGWELLLPAGNADAPNPPPQEEDELDEAVHTVQDGETLSQIALDHLGDATAYPQVFEANEGQPQEAGSSLTDPDLIHPGWDLTIPTPSEVSDESENGEPTEPAGESESEEGTDGEEPTDATDGTAPSGAQSSAPESADEDQAQDYPQSVDKEPESTPPPPAPSVAAPETPHAGTVDEDVSLDATLSADDSDLAQTAAPWAGYSALAAAGLSAILLMRRRIQQRDRRPGQRIVQSEDPQIDQAEADLHASSDPASVELLDRALRSLSAKCASTQSPLPHILGARLGSNCELLVGDRQGIPVTPFRQLGERTWRVDTTSSALLSEEAARQVPAPYPGLATLGQDHDGAQILLDLPQAGAIGLSGADTAITEVLTSLAVELSTSPAADHVNVTCIGDIAPGLAQLVKTGRVRAFPDVDACLKELELQTLEYASTGPSEDIAPEVVLSARPLSGQHLERLSHVLGSAAAPPIALIAKESEAHPLPGTWHLQVEGEQALPGLTDVSVTLQRVSQDSYAQIRTLLETAEVAVSVPAPGWEQVPQEPQRVPTSSITTPAEPSASVSALMDLSEPAPVQPRPLGALRPKPLTDYEVQLRVLGQVEILGPDTSTLEPGRRRSLTELACYLKLRPGRTPDQISRSMGGPRGPWTTSTRSAHLSKLRVWLGRDAAGAPHLPTQTGGTYVLAPSVGCDWEVFQELAKLGLAEDTQRATTLLEEALDLVRDEPFSGVGLDRYGWAEPLKPEMHAAMVDVAHTIAMRHLRDGFLEAARTALAKVLELDPACELLYRDLFRIEHKAHNPEAITRAVQRLHIALDQLDLEMSEETEKLLTDLRK
ncbi:LysM peptidoglycan-binding domain-containing protein [Nocardiopsis tropica]|uniref:LysM peptidoglycan-binding domain-containing protein n=1 Tax=Nocardiopsis tropica TaxID=109330 RepID=A0ABU7KMS2_9ACTN|nr:LysM peptidoglycan-binding domain-containing protein [Nocardiopsis umidischolae]MEE2050585.1 LysM peptidoglycan-binding domain-containing protein [Nocardiopsis umidischolae]